MGEIIDLEPNYSYEGGYSEWADHGQDGIGRLLVFLRADLWSRVDRGRLSQGPRPGPGWLPSTPAGTLMSSSSEVSAHEH